MATDFPTDLDSFGNPTATDKTNNPDHATQHANVNDAIEAVQAKLGKDSSAVTTSHDYKLTPRIITLVDAATVDIDLSQTGIFTLTIAGDRALTISNPGTGGKVFALRVVQGAGGSHLISSWFTGFTLTWVSAGSAPVLKTTAGQIDTFTFIMTSATTIDGYIAG
jgi:hypothetical protein